MPAAQAAPAPPAGQGAPAPQVKPPTPRPARVRRVKIGEWEAQQQFADAMRGHGLKPQGLPVLDGKLRYVAVEGNKGREKSGAYRGFYDEGRPAGAIYNWKQGGFVGTWKAEGELVPTPMVSARAGTRPASPPNIAAFCCRVAGVSAFSRVHDISADRGSLKPIWPATAGAGRAGRCG